MAETTDNRNRRRSKPPQDVIGEVVSTKMAKTIVVEVLRKKAHPFYKRVVSQARSFMRTTKKRPGSATWCGSKRPVRCPS